MTLQEPGSRAEPLPPRRVLAAHVGGLLWAMALIVGLAVILARLAHDVFGG
ncbi:hypothetical protein [Ralstonia solanacearum]|nr:hypothetical protein [Ralstonia solanacearum]MBB6588955.1 hypothetical protein [Ralstonia solanacearum]MCG3576512.1 hypothetical protein [Ralstonia solanacearum]MCL9823653.1 hypothetical protein [Ralstonia solanacearum]MCL9832185.1 hypothetical protein [Ralstonia solanacearum]MCL9836966.1 hypothetical protein [Ralstonia solanacearum]